MIKRILSEKEKQILHGYFKASPLILIRLKAQAMLMRDRGIICIDIVGVLLRNERTIRR
ncbi:MAG TPA: hypothetical protein VNW29_07030 [Candidatus Sulfotelmatobacter sp.]|nr:hypothetical protein [Candidatus Sulfotelmatobacter sp.]